MPVCIGMIDVPLIYSICIFFEFVIGQWVIARYFLGLESASRWKFVYNGFLCLLTVLQTSTLNTDCFKNRGYFTDSYTNLWLELLKRTNPIFYPKKEVSLENYHNYPGFLQRKVQKFSTSKSSPQLYFSDYWKSTLIRYSICFPGPTDVMY